MSSDTIPANSVSGGRVFKRSPRDLADLRVLAQHNVDYDRALVLAERIDALWSTDVQSVLAAQGVHLFGFEILASGDVPDAPFSGITGDVGIMVIWLTPTDAPSENPYVYAVALQGPSGPTALKPTTEGGPTNGGIFVAHFDGDENTIAPEFWCERLAATAVDTGEPSDGPVDGERVTFEITENPFLWAPQDVWYAFGGNLALRGTSDHLSMEYGNVRYRHFEWLVGLLGLSAGPTGGPALPAHQFFDLGLRRVPMWAPDVGQQIEGTVLIEGGNADPALQPLLTYMGIGYDTFGPHEGAYFDQLDRLMASHGIAMDTTVDASNYTTYVKEFQRQAGFSAQNQDGIPGKGTLWELQKDYKSNENRSVDTLPADKWVRPPLTIADHKPNRDGYNQTRLRTDAGQAYRALYDEAKSLGATAITSAGGYRPLTAAVTSGRSSRSLHYPALAFDLSTPTGMRDPSVDPFLITDEGDYWRVYARTDEGSGTERTLNAVVWQNGTVNTSETIATVLDFTALARSHGFYPIPPRSSWPGNYLSSEWWHFQYEDALVPYLSQIGAEVLALQGVSEADFGPSMNAAKKDIFRRGANNRSGFG